MKCILNIEMCAIERKKNCAKRSVEMTRDCTEENDDHVENVLWLEVCVCVYARVCFISLLVISLFSTVENSAFISPAVPHRVLCVHISFA